MSLPGIFLGRRRQKSARSPDDTIRSCRRCICNSPAAFKVDAVPFHLYMHMDSGFALWDMTPQEELAHQSAVLEQSGGFINPAAHCAKRRKTLPWCMVCTCYRVQTQMKCKTGPIVLQAKHTAFAQEDVPASSVHISMHLPRLLHYRHLAATLRAMHTAMVAGSW